MKKSVLAMPFGIHFGESMMNLESPSAIELVKHHRSLTKELLFWNTISSLSCDVIRYLQAYGMEFPVGTKPPPIQRTQFGDELLCYRCFSKLIS